MPVEFLSTEPDEPDPGPRNTSRQAALLRIAAAVAVLVALVVWAVTRPEGGARRASVADPPASAPASTTPPPDTVVAFHCAVGAPLDNGIESAMWHYFRGIAIRNLGVFRCERGSGPSGRVLFQAVSGRYHGVNIDLEARLRTAHGVDAGVSPHLGSVHGQLPLLAQIKAISVNLEVTVNAYGPPGAAVPGDRMQKLCDFVSLNLVL